LQRQILDKEAPGAAERETEKNSVAGLGFSTVSKITRTAGKASQLRSVPLRVSFMWRAG
jgi:hypothetical protein